jgi:Domain of unknown function (DUF1772)
MISFLNGAAIVSIGLMIGVEFAVWVFINPILWKLEEPTRSYAIRLFAKKLGTAMPFWYAGNLLALLADAVLLRNQPTLWLMGVAAGIWIAVIILTLLFLVPINNRLAQPELAMSLDQAHSEHKRWDLLHRARVMALGVAMVLLLAAIHL